MRADLEIVCGFIEAGKTAFINALNELTKIKEKRIRSKSAPIKIHL